MQTSEVLDKHNIFIYTMEHVRLTQRILVLLLCRNPKWLMASGIALESKKDITLSKLNLINKTQWN